MKFNFFLNSIKSIRINIIFFLTISLVSYSQIENSKRKIELLPPASAAIKKLDITPTNPNYFSLKKKEKSSTVKRLDKKENFLNPGDIYLKKLNREKDKKPNDYNKGAYLGDVSTGSSYVNILCRDFEYVDGDRVRISVNDSIVIYNLYLESTFSGFKLPLSKGFNKIDFTALNQGSSGPNTAELRVFDDSNSLISSNQWNLSTGAKATFIVVKK
ncbi:MAG: hypothetical protein EVA39_06695 [Flavobacteriales bacterium]|nr:MAG: hypothetical protein EVA39_06695 [Flavobacteriales bacterium]